MPNEARRIVTYLLEKIEAEPLETRAALYDDLASFLPNEHYARALRRQALHLRQADKDSRCIRIALSAGLERPFNQARQHSSNFHD